VSIQGLLFGDERRDLIANPEPGGLEVGAFGRVERDRMVGRRAGHCQELDAAPRLPRRGLQERLEVGGGKQARAGTGQERFGQALKIGEDQESEASVGVLATSSKEQASGPGTK
jgi:hypothetical protein